MSNPKLQEPVPWHYYTATQAAKLLGVHVDFLGGFVNSPLRACHRPGRSGREITLFNRDDVDQLVLDMAAQG